MKQVYRIGPGMAGWIKWFLIVLITGLSGIVAYSQTGQSKSSRQSAIEAFSRGNYETALKEFNELLLVYSKDPLYKYYSGVCQVKLKRDPGNAVALLQQALQGAAVIRNVPADGWFYLGRAQQMEGRYADAINSFNVFKEQSGKKSAREFNVAEYIRQCNEKKGQLSEADVSNADAEKRKEAESPKAEKPEIKATADQKASGKTDKPVEKLPAGYDKLIAEALDYQVKADSLNSIAVRSKKELETLPEPERAAMKARISETERMSLSYQKLADEKYDEAMASIDRKTSTGIGKKSKSDNLPDVRPEKPEQDLAVQKEPVPGPVKKPEATYTSGRRADLFSVFEIISNPVYGSDEKIIIDPVIPDGLIYRIQVAVFRNPVAPAVFKGITPVYGFRVAGTDRTNYYVGMFRRHADAGKALAAVRQKGFKDAFIVSLSGGKPVSSERAAILEKEWGEKPFSSGVGTGSDDQRDTIPPTLSFRVEVMRSEKPAKEDIVGNMRKIAGTRGMDIFTTGEGNVVYLIGKFITFESASGYADLLVRNGYRDAKVVAWLGKREIPLDIAKQLFEKIE